MVNGRFMMRCQAALQTPRVGLRLRAEASVCNLLNWQCLESGRAATFDLEWSLRLQSAYGGMQ